MISAIKELLDIIECIDTINTEEDVEVLHRQAEKLRVITVGVSKRVKEIFDEQA